jgi:hypothetical protein
VNHTVTRTKPVRTRALGVVVQPEEEEEGVMGSEGMNGHDSSEKRGAEDNQEGEGEGMIGLYCWHVCFQSSFHLSIPL